MSGHSWGAWVDTDIKVRKTHCIDNGGYLSRDTETTTEDYIAVHQLQECKICFLTRTKEEARDSSKYIPCVI